MYEIIIALWMLANPADNTKMTYIAETYETLEACEADKPKVEALLWDYIRQRFDAGPETIGATLTCELQ
jgi:hypothetical protein